jgi:nucleoside-diphosphate-sugar epimerase
MPFTVNSPLTPALVPPRRRILVTGASGFIGRAVCHSLVGAGWTVHGQVLRGKVPPGCTPLVANLEHDLSSILAHLPQVDAVVHLAGLAHAPVEHLDRALLWRINVHATQQLAEFAARQQAHFVFLSTAKVLGESGEWHDDALPNPADPYAESKLAAEIALSSTPGSATTIVRPPLVYGPHVKGNFLRLLRLANSGWPLPLALDTPRSLLYVDNLAAALLAILEHREASIGRTWLVSDGRPISLSDLIRDLGHALGRDVRLFRIKPAQLIVLAKLVGRHSSVRKLIEPFVVHDLDIRRCLSWHPPCDTASALRATARWFLADNFEAS